MASGPRITLVKNFVEQNPGKNVFIVSADPMAMQVPQGVDRSKAAQITLTTSGSVGVEPPGTDEAGERDTELIKTSIAGTTAEPKPIEHGGAWSATDSENVAGEHGRGCVRPVVVMFGPSEDPDRKTQSGSLTFFTPF